MTRWQHVQEVFHAALERPSGERAVFIARECSDDSGLRREVEALLTSHRSSPGDSLEDPQADEVARLLEHAPLREERRIGRRIGSYQVVRVIGSGGMGTVYEAVQESPQRTVALKIMKGGMPSRSALRRFVEEAHILARLSHPGLAQVYEAGAFDDDGASVPYFAMELLAHAGTIIEVAARRDLPVADRLELFASVCDAVHHAHVKGIIHRDLKPANILVVEEADGPHSVCRAKVIDFGVARVTDARAAATTQGSDVRQLIGTLQYMSPEQCSGEPGRVDVRSDIYALGVVLFELLAGRLPYDLEGNAIPEVTRIIAQVEPARLGALDRTLRGDLETIVAKALEKDPERRYASAGALAADVRRHLQCEPILARPSSVLYQLGKFARRNTGLVAGMIGVALSLIVGLAASTILYLKARDARAEAEFREYVADIAAASAALRANDVADARQRLEQAPEPLRNFEWRHLSRCLDRSAMTLGRRGEAVATIALNPDETILASGGSDNMIRLWNPATGATLMTLPWHTHVATSVVFSRDGSRLLTGSADLSIKLWNVAVDPPILIREFRGSADHVYRAIFSSDESMIISCGKDKVVRVWNVADGSIRATLTSHTDRVHAVALAPDGRTFASSSWDGTVKIWDANTFDELATLEGHTGPVYGIAFSPDGARLASASFDHTVRIWDLASRRTTLIVRGHTDIVYAVAFSPDGARLATGSADRTMRIWNADTGEEITRLLGHDSHVRAVLFAGDGKSVFSSSSDGTIKRWSATADPVPTLRGHEAWVYGVALTPDGGLLATAGGGRFPRGDGSVRIWDMATHAVRHVLRGHEDLVFCVAFAPDGRLVASGAADRTVRLWDAVSGASIATLTGHSDLIRQIAFSPDGRWVASASYDGSVGVWNVPGPADTASPAAPTLLRRADTRANIHSVAWFADSLRLAAGNDDGTISNWNLREGREVARIAAHSEAVTALAISRDGRWIVSGSPGAEVVVHEAASGTRLATLHGHSGRINSLAFSADGSRLASASDDYAIKLWDTGSWREVAALTGHTNIVWSVCFSPDGQSLASGSADLTARLWDAPSRLSR